VGYVPTSHCEQFESSAEVQVMSPVQLTTGVHKSHESAESPGMPSLRYDPLAHVVHWESDALEQVSCDVQWSISPHGTHDEPSALRW
jgi:hypothetical protein